MKAVALSSQLVFDKVVQSSRTNGPLAGAMIWNAALNDTIDIDGYNVLLEKWPRPDLMAGGQATVGAAEGPIGASGSSLPPAVGAIPAAGGGFETLGRRLRALWPWDSAGSRGRTTDVQLRAAEDNASEATEGATGCGGLLPDARCAATAGGAASWFGGFKRALRWQSDALDGFRRGWDRGSCANEAAKTWRPDPPPVTVDVAAAKRVVQGLEDVDLIKNATNLLRR